MSKYEPLAEHLDRRKDVRWSATFEEIERVLGFALPSSAHRYPAWWANQNGPGHSQTRGWRSVGWRTADLDLERETVIFEREAECDIRGRGFGPASHSSPMLEKARSITGIEDRDRLIEKALEALIAGEASRRLARLGGTMPDFEPVPRDRRGG